MGAGVEMGVEDMECVGAGGGRLWGTGLGVFPTLAFPLAFTLAFELAFALTLALALSNGV
jgi:hypothetical protein